MSRLALACESINFQIKELLFKELTAEFNNIRSSGKVTREKIAKSQLNAIVFKNTKISVNFKLDEADGVNAYVYPPQIDINHPLISNAWRHSKGNIDSLSAIRATKTMISGAVERATSMVSGVFSDITCDLALSKGLLDSSQYSDGEVAAISLHEIGHIFTYYEFLALNLRVNAVMLHANNAMQKADGLAERIVILKATEDTLNIKLDDLDGLAKSNSKEVVNTLIMSSVIESTRSELGSNIYDQRSWEALCDNFATRHGAGRELATALDKINRVNGSSSYRSAFMFTMLEAVKGTFFFTAMISTALLGLPFVTSAYIYLFGLLIILTNPMDRIYDEPGERTKRIRSQVVEALKQPKIDEQRRLALLADLDVIDALMESINDRRGILEMFWTTVVPYGRRQQAQKETQQQLEALVSNELFVKAAQFKSFNV